MRTFAKILVLSIALSGCSGGAGTPEVVSSYLDALIDGDYARAYELTSLASVSQGGGEVSGGAVTAEHFGAWWRGQELRSYRIARPGTNPTVELRSDAGSRTVIVVAAGGRIQADVQEHTLGSRGGPLPGLVVDGIPAEVAGRPDEIQGALGATGEVAWIYRFYVLRGSHRIVAPAGPVTPEEEIDGSELALSLSPAGRATADTVVTTWKSSCGDRCRVSSCAGVGEFSFGPAELKPAILGLVGTLGIKGAMTREGWTIAARGNVRDTNVRIDIAIDRSGSARTARACFGDRQD